MSLVINATKERSSFTVNISCECTEHITGIYGHSGAGKTTLLHMIAGLVKPDSGTITCGGRTLVDVEKGIWVPPHKRRIGIVFQEGRLFPHLRVKKNLTYGHRFIGKRQKKISFDEIVDLLEIRHLLTSYPSSLSGGERQRVAIGRTLLSEPELLLFDEPFSAVDVTLRQQIMPFIKRLRDTLDIPILIVSHDMPDILQLTYNLLLLKQGKVIGNGSVFDLVKDQTAYTLIHGAGLINNLDFRIVSSDSHTMILDFDDNNNTPLFKAPAIDGKQQGDKVTGILHPSDIAISREMISNTSIQNQIPGQIETITMAQKAVILTIDTGKTIMVELSQESVKRLNLAVGDSIYALFKSHSLSIS